MQCPKCQHKFTPQPKTLAREMGKLGGRAGKGKKNPAAAANAIKAREALKLKRDRMKENDNGAN